MSFFLSYANPWLRTRAYTIDLQNPSVLEGYRMKGYTWIRRLERKNFCDIVRSPTVGCFVELSVIRYPGCVPIDSRQGQKIIQKLCYF